MSYEIDYDVNRKVRGGEEGQDIVLSGTVELDDAIAHKIVRKFVESQAYAWGSTYGEFVETGETETPYEFVLSGEAPDLETFISDALAPKRFGKEAKELAAKAVHAFLIEEGKEETVADTVSELVESLNKSKALANREFCEKLVPILENLGHQEYAEVISGWLKPEADEGLLDALTL